MIFAHTSHGQFPNHFHQVQQQKTEISLNSLKIDFQIINEIYCQLFHIMNNQYFCLRWIKVKTVLYKFPTANKTGNWVTNACKSIFPFIEFVHNFFDQNFKKELFLFLSCSYRCNKPLGSRSSDDYLSSYRRLLTCCLAQPNINNMQSWNPMTSFLSIYSYLIRVCSSERNSS